MPRVAPTLTEGSIVAALFSLAVPIVFANHQPEQRTYNLTLH